MEQKQQTYSRKVMTQLRNMAVGDSLTFPIEKMDLVRTQASKCNIMLGGKWTTMTDREARTIQVDRIA